MFVYNKAYGSWNRVLTIEDGLSFELNLIPVGCAWDVIKQERFFVTSASRSADESIHISLPPGARWLMEAELDKEFMDRLLNYNYLSEVTIASILAAQKKMTNGCLFFHSIKEFNHPYSGSNHLRRCARDITEIISQNHICSCGSYKIKSVEINTQPEGSTANLCTCQSCGRQWEMAYTLVQAMCVLKEHG